MSAWQHERPTLKSTCAWRLNAKLDRLAVRLNAKPLLSNTGNCSRAKGHTAGNVAIVKDNQTGKYYTVYADGQPYEIQMP